jgi:hypothetical protein
MQRRMRESSSPVREAPSRAVGASRIAEPLRFWLKAFAFAIAAGAFLAFVGAFGSDAMPVASRYATYIAISVILMLTAFGVVELLRRIRSLTARPWLYQAVIVAVLTPATAVVVWAIVGFAVMGVPRPRLLPVYLLTSFGMTVAMSALSQLVFRDYRFRPPAAAEADAPPGPVRFLERLPANLRGADLWAVQAEDHYVRLHTSKGSALILLRLADAAAELEGLEGARVHRSWWVAKSAVAGTARRGGQTVLKLPNGVEAPVSRTQAADLRREGWW